MYAPMRRAGKPIGVLSIQSYTPGAYNQEDLLTLQALADYCAGALERFRTEQALELREDLNRTILATAMDGFFTLDFSVDRGGAIVDVNDAYCRLVGYRRDELLQMRIADLEAAESSEEIARHKAKIMSTGADRFETRHRHKSGKEIQVEISVSMLGGSGERVFGFVRDITTRKRAELAKEAFLTLGTKLSVARTAVEAGKAIFATADQLWEWHCATLDLCLPEADGVQSVLNYDIVEGQRREIAANLESGQPSPRMQRIMSQGPELILREPPCQPGDDSIMIGDISRPSKSLMCVPLRREDQAVGVLTLQSYTANAFTPEDLRTLEALADHVSGALERIHAETALRESEELLRAFYDSPGGLRGVVELQEDDLLVLSTNASQALAYGRTVEDMRQTFATELGVPPPVVSLWLDKLRQSQKDNTPVTFEYSTDFRLPGSWCLATVSPLRMAASTRPRFAFVALNITERKRAETALRAEHDMLEQRVQERTAELGAANEALHEAHDQLERRVQERTAELQAANAALAESEERYRSLVNNLNVGVYRNTAGPHGRFIQVNPALARMHGYDSVDEFQKIKVADLYQDPGDRAAFVAGLLRQGAVVNHELRLKKKDGTAIYGSVNATVHRGPDGEVDWIDGVLEDITQRKQAERTLAEALELNRTLISASTVGIAAYKASGQCILANEALARITGGTLQQLLQQDFRHLQSWLSGGLLAKADAALKTGQPQEIEAQNRTTFGRKLVIHARLSSFTIQDEQHLLLVVTDETEATRAEQALRASEERYRTLAESSPDAIFILNQDGKVQYVNSTAASSWRRKAEELIGLSQAELFSPETAKHNVATLAEVFKTGKPVCRDEPLSFPTGDQWVETRLAPLYGEQGAVVSVMGVCRDITERKRAERQLAEALDLNQKMIAAATMGFAAYKASGECVFANAALAKAVGGSVSEVVQGNFRRLASWRKSGLLKLAQEALGENQARSGVFHSQTRFGKDVWMDCQVALFVSNDQPHLLLMALDITQRKIVEEALKEAQRLQKAILDNLPDPVWLKDVKGRFLACNQALARVYGQSMEAIIGKTTSDFAPDETARLTRQDRQIIRSGQSIMVDVPLRDAQGQVKWFETIKSALLNERGEVTGMVGAAREITQRKQAEDALKMQSFILQNMAEGALLIGPDMTILFANSALEAAFGYEPGELIGKSVTVLNAWPEADTGRFNQQASRIAKRDGLWIGEYQNRRKDGTLFTSEARVSVLDLDGQTHYVSVQQDITDRKRLERQILEISDREQARIGQDIHDGLCQHLVSLAFDANSLEQRLSAQRRPEAETARRLVDFLDQAITESRQLSRGLFPVRLAQEGLAPALEELAKTTCDRFKLQCRFESQGPVAVENSAIATHLYRIAQEAVTNAVKHSRAQSVRICLRDHAAQLELRVEDNGTGLSPAARQQSKGMGLHIMAYRARLIGGILHLKPSRRGGTVVSCCVPRPRS
jgi:PAS domain S-box-containing protein